MAGLRISVKESEQLQAVLLAVKNLDSSTQKWIRQETRSQSLPIWQGEVQDHVETRLEQRVLSDTARVNASNQNVTLTSATSGRRMQGGATPTLLAKAVEFGANRDATSTYRNRRGRDVTRHTTRQFRGTNRKGYVVYPAAAGTIPRLASLWAQTVARAVYDAFEGKSDG